MKHRIAKICSILLYMVVLVVLLYLQQSRIETLISEIVANILTLVLALPTIWTLRSWLKKDEIDTGSDKQISADHNIIKSMDIECLREQFDTYMAQRSLSEREVEVAWLIYRGYTNLQIAEELFISETTVKKHAGHIYEKLNITSRKELKEIHLNELL